MLTLVEGSSYTATWAVTNASFTTDGEPASAVLRTQLGSDLGLSIPIPEISKEFAPEEKLVMEFPFSVPQGLGGKSGRIEALVISPNRTVIAQVQETITIAVTPVKFMFLSWQNAWVYDPCLGGEQYAYVSLLNQKTVQDNFVVGVDIYPDNPDLVTWTRASYGGMVLLLPGQQGTAVCGPGPIPGLKQYVPSFDVWVSLVVQSQVEGFKELLRMERFEKITITLPEWAQEVYEKPWTEWSEWVRRHCGF